MAWHLAPSLVRFRTWNRAKWPNQNNGMDGSIGDLAHQGTTSDHNPNSRQSVNAVDEDERGIHMPTLMVAAMVHPSISYVIYEKFIYNVVRQFVRKAYTGTNPHDKHGHFSIFQTVKAEQSKTEWGVSSWPTLHRGSTGRGVSELQAYLNVYGWPIKVDGDFGALTERAVREFQVWRNVPQSVDNGRGDGVVGAHTEYAIKTCTAYQGLKTRW